MHSIQLYFHIPFCTKKCDYCHFYVIKDKAPLHDLLMEGLLLDIARHTSELSNNTIRSIYFGGGTPSLLGAENVSKLLAAVHALTPFNNKKIEITLEANPETLTEALIKNYAAAGINRVSIGVQSFDDLLLAKLGRTHHASAAVRAVENTLKAGISNISIDLMYDIPCQTLSSWEKTVKQAAALPITHLSLYNLTIEPQTLFFKYQESLRKELPDAESSTQMYRMATDIFQNCGLIQYEISAFARNGHYSRHNVGYWTGFPFLGFGPSAFSYWKGMRFRTIANLQRYVEALRAGIETADFCEKLSPEKSRRELLAIALRLRAGVDLETFEERNGRLEEGTKEALKRLIEEGLLVESMGKVALTEKGILFYDTVAVEIV